MYTYTSYPITFKKTNDSISLSDMRARWGRTNNPLWEKTRSTGAQLAGVHSRRSNSGNIKANSDLWTMVDSGVIDAENVDGFFYQCSSFSSCETGWSTSQWNASRAAAIRKMSLSKANVLELRGYVGVM